MRTLEQSIKFQKSLNTSIFAQVLAWVDCAPQISRYQRQQQAQGALKMLAGENTGRRSSSDDELSPLFTALLECDALDSDIVLTRSVRIVFDTSQPLWDGDRKSVV